MVTSATFVPTAPTYHKMRIVFVSPVIIIDSRHMPQENTYKPKSSFYYVLYSDWPCSRNSLAIWLYFLRKVSTVLQCGLRGGADNSLARPGRKQATATKLGINSKYSPRNSTHFLARCSDFCKQLKKKSECCPSNQVSAAEITSASDEKLRPFNCFFSPGNRW